MGLSSANLLALKSFTPSSLIDSTLDFFEFMKYDSDQFRELDLIRKDDFFKAFIKNQNSRTKKETITKVKLKKKFDELCKKLDSVLFVKNSSENITEIKWEKIDSFCDLLRLAERSDERKIRWSIYHLYCAGKKEFSIDSIQSMLSEFKISNAIKILNKIIKVETLSGLDAKFDGKKLSLNHELNDKMVSHYLADAIEESSRRSPGKLEQEMLDMLDEGSFSNQELSKILSVDEAMISRTISKLRKQNKIILSSFGERGTRYYITNCDNCPFGTTKASCKKEALSYIITTLKEDFNIDLTSNDFEDIETNQALLQMKRIFMMARKEKNTKLEKNLNENIAKIMSSIVDHAFQVNIPSKNVKVSDVKMQIKPVLSNLPSLYQLGLQKGAKSGILLVDDLLRLATKSIKKEDRLLVKSHAIEETNKFLKRIGVN